MSENPNRRAGRPAAALAALALAVLAAAAVLYGKAPAPGKAEGDCPAASGRARARSRRSPHGELAALAVDARAAPRRCRSPSSAPTAAS